MGMRSCLVFIFLSVYSGPAMLIHVLQGSQKCNLFACSTYVYVYVSLVDVCARMRVRVFAWYLFVHAACA